MVINDKRDILRDAAQKAHNIKDLKEKEKVFNDCLESAGMTERFFYSKKTREWKRQKKI